MRRSTASRIDRLTSPCASGSPPDCFHEVRYADLDLGGFEALRPKIERYFEEHKGYKTNRYPNLSAETRAEIARRWDTVIERYGYVAPPG